MTPEARKYRIIEQIVAIQDERFLTSIDLFVTSALKVAHLAKPMRETLFLEEAYQGINQNTFHQIINDIGIEEHIEELIASTLP